MEKKIFFVGNSVAYLRIFAKNERGARLIASRIANSSLEFAFLKYSKVFPSLEAMNSYYNKPLSDDFC